MSGRVKGYAFAACVLAGLIAVAACKGKPVPGSACTTPGKLACLDGQNALVCKAGAYVAIPCRGSHGCKQVGGEADCDDDLANEGDPCHTTVHENYACSTDHTKALVCREAAASSDAGPGTGARFQLWRHCRGPKGCTTHGTTVECDTSLAEAGDPCGQPGSYACSVDRTQMFTCQDDKLRAASSCRGPGGCVVNTATNKVECDNAIALEGDPCNHEDGESCSLDGKSLLVCKGHTYVTKKACRRKDGCVVKNHEIYCDF